MNPAGYISSMAWVPVAFLYFLVVMAALVLLASPIQTVWRAAWVRPLLRKYSRMKGERKSLPVAVQNSERYKKTLREEEALHNTRMRAWLSLSLMVLVAEGSVVMQGYRWPPVPGNLGEINKFVAAAGAHAADALGRNGPIWPIAGVIGAVVLGLVAMNLLDLLGDALGTPVRAAKDMAEQKRKEARLAKEAAAAPRPVDHGDGDAAGSVVNYYAELDVPTSARSEAVAATLAGVEAQWNRRLAKGDEAMQGRARRYLEMVAEARGILLDPEKRIAYDKKIGLRAGDGPAGPRKPSLVDARKVDDAAAKHIEEMKRKRKAEKTKGDPS